ncbi:MAG TPA: helix-turn-helix transcriptional regulator [Streptosporangiaceae bacterium]|jgi:transcriptional regulator with XRE-family HTH domain|nr:helix-turn-helix transcriptional regulator [Streptosporangiaceae bacterium]
MRVSSIGEYIREQREQAKISLRQLADAAGVSNPYLSQIERGLRRPSAEILQQIARGLRISAEALYVQAGILEDRAPDSGVRAAVLAAPELTERQKQVLLEIYDSFRKEAAAQAEQSAAAEAAAVAEAGALADAIAAAQAERDAAPDDAPADAEEEAEALAREQSAAEAEAVAKAEAGRDAGRWAGDDTDDPLAPGGALGTDDVCSNGRPGKENPS